MIEQKKRIKKFCFRQLSDNNKNCFNMTKCIPLNDFLLFLLQKIIIQTSRINNWTKVMIKLYNKTCWWISHKNKNLLKDAVPHINKASFKIKIIVLYKNNII